MRDLFSFPDPVNEVAARLVAGGVLVMAIAFVATGWTPLLVVLAYGFLARVAAGPRFSPLGLLVTRVVVPRLGLPARPVPGPPKRFAQAIGAVFSVNALVLAVGPAWDGAARALIALLAVAAFLESVVGYCLGCTIFAALMRAGVIPAEVCEACADVTKRLPQPATDG